MSHQLPALEKQTHEAPIAPDRVAAARGPRALLALLHDALSGAERDYHQPARSAAPSSSSPSPWSWR